MTGNHPHELHLARLSDDVATEKVEQHLRWCARCRHALAEYRYLEGEVTAALEAEVIAVPVPRADWGAVSARVHESPLQASRKRLVVAATAALVACVMVAAPPLLGRHVQAQPTGVGGVSGAPHPVVAAGSHSDTDDGTSLARASAGPEKMVTLPFVPPPTPPDVDA